MDRRLKILKVQKFRKIVITNGSSRSPKRCFSVTTGSISYMRITNNNFTFIEKDLNQILVHWLFASKSRQSRKSRVFFGIMLKFKIIYFCKYKLNFFQQGLNRTMNLFGKELDLRFVFHVP